eukprot:SAG22_NODE_333_length_12162_cov_11.415237_5_plen_715_part_00
MCMTGLMPPPPPPCILRSCAHRYEGGGIYRKTWLTRAPPLHLATDGIFSRSTIKSSTSNGLTAVAALIVSATLQNMQSTKQSAALTFDLFGAEDISQAASGTTVVAVPAAVSVSNPSASTTTISIQVKGLVKLWSPAQPALYTLRTRVGSDVVNTTVGFRDTNWSANTGFYLNDVPSKIRGFCNHNSLGGLGMVLPDRVNLFRAQAMRNLGANSWRTAHNPPEPGLLDVLDRVGVMAMDENRIYTADACYDDECSDFVMNMAALVARDRSHPSVIMWSYCNEGGCGKSGGPQYRNATHRYDNTRPTLGNGINQGAGTGSTSMDERYTDISGFSHVSSEVFDAYHLNNPSRPMIASECCSCNPSRVLRGGDKRHSSSGIACAAGSTEASDGRDFVSGSFVWTGFDYYGESHGWPSVSSPFGAYDLAGFEKSTAHWYRSWWLAAIPATDIGRPRGFGDVHTCHFSLPWGQLQVPYKTASKSWGVEVLTDLPTVKLFQDGELINTSSVMKFGWASIPWTPPGANSTNLTAVCEDHAGTLRSQTLLKPGPAVALVLTIDAPSNTTGTGEALLLDGHDVALLRASVVDTAGTLVFGSTANITFEVTNGPGRMIGTHNGDDQCHEPDLAPWHSAFGGLIRGIVKVTRHSDARLSSIDRESAQVTLVGTEPEAITVVARSPGLKTATVTIAVSTNEMHSPLAAAARSVADDGGPGARGYSF